jgi:hypothetical protein
MIAEIPNYYIPGHSFLPLICQILYTDNINLQRIDHFTCRNLIPLNLLITYIVNKLSPRDVLKIISMPLETSYCIINKKTNDFTDDWNIFITHLSKMIQKLKVFVHNFGSIITS